VFDGWSKDLMYRELWTLYEAFARGDSSPLHELQIQYGDFAAWQQRRFQNGQLARELNYWREQLRNLPTLDLATDYARPSAQTFTGATHQMHLPPSLVQAMKSLGRREGVTLFMVLLAAFQALLHRYSGQNDIVVGTPIAGRTRIEVEELIGFFVNMLVLRTDASGDPTFREFLRRAGKVAFDAYAHQEIPFEKLVEELHPHREPSRNPLFQVAFALQNAPRSTLSPNQLNVTWLQTARAYAKFDLEVHLEEIEGGLRGQFIYNTALFKSATIVRTARHFRAILDSLVAEPDLRLSQLTLLAKEEQHQILVEWNRTETNYPRDTSIHGLFESRANATPDALAVEFGSRRLTYRELNERSNRLAHHLKTLGVGRDVLVGLFVDRSIDMLVGIVAILKAGGAYVPLEPSYPRERIAFILHDAGLSVLVTESGLLANLPTNHAQLVRLDDPEWERCSPASPEAGTTAEDLAYVLYTSGSTGRPKGVAVPHRAVVRLVVDTNYVQVKSTDRFAQVSNPSFDAATFEIWGALLNGASLIGISQNVLLSPREFARAIQEQRISTMFLTTALFNQMAAEEPTAFQSLRYLLFGGETCDPKWVRTLLEYGSSQQLLHMYGPTEGTTFTTWHRVKSVAAAATTIPIGRPIANTHVYLLDRALQPVPVGVVGELCIAGDGLAREYLNRPEVTAEKFIRNPFSDDPSARLYKTGDFARYLTDGSIDFVGRVDQQIKIRGFRVELPEIEAVLSQHPEVGSCVVVARRRGETEKSLVAFVVPSGDARPSAETLRRFVRDQLPDYMTPSAFVIVHALPLTPNGKVDRAALPALEHDDREATPRFAGPRTPVEKGLVEIWERLLGVKPIGIHDNFFDLGGHSLLAIQLIARVERKFGTILPVAVLFQSPTIAHLAHLLSDAGQQESWSPLIPVQPEGSKQPFFWIHGDSSNAFLPEYLESDRPFYSFEHQGHDGRPALYFEVGTIATHYLTQVRRMCPHGPYVLGGYCFGAVVALEIARQLAAEGEAVALLFMLDPPGHVMEESPTPRGAFDRIGDELAPLRFGQKVPYLLSRLKTAARDRIQVRTARVATRIKRLRAKTCVWRGALLPPSLRSTYVLDVYRRALRVYAPLPYGGRVTIFKGDKLRYRSPMDWTTLLTGELEIDEAPGGHMDFTKEPHVGVWAARLRRSLDQVGL
jgi:aspartate racemase